MIFMLLLSVYDFLSVFWTKHMVQMAKAITEKPMAFTAALPCKTKKIKHTFQLGGGDIAIPLMFSASALRFYGLVPAIFAVAGALIALLLLFSTVLKNPGHALPALPPISAGAIVGFAVAVLLL
jgi:presenilin-like A22 family membrane protease